MRLDLTAYFDQCSLAVGIKDETLISVGASITADVVQSLKELFVYDPHQMASAAADKQEMTVSEQTLPLISRLDDPRHFYDHGQASSKIPFRVLYQPLKSSGMPC